MNIDLSQFRDGFFQDADEHVENMEAGLLRIEAAVDAGDAPVEEDLHEVFRDAHSIKGAAGSLGFDSVTRFTHALEGVLDRLRDGRLAPTSQRTGLLLRSVDALRTLLAATQAGAETPAGIADQLAELEGDVEDDAAPAPSAGSVPDAEKDDEVISYEVGFRAADNLFQSGMDPLLVLRELSELCESGSFDDVQLQLDRIPPLADLDPELCSLAWTCRMHSDASRGDIEDVFLFVEDGSEITIREVREAQAQESSGEAKSLAVAKSKSGGKAGRGAPARGVQKRESSSIRVSTEKVDKLIDLVGELVIAQSMASQAVQDFDPSKPHLLGQALEETQRYVRELQEQIMGVRMLPIGSVFSRFPRLIRDIASNLDKKIALEISGEETELDKGVVEGITDPLTHLIRNSADHGIESPEERIAAGKPEQGVIHLRAFHRGGNVVIEIEDDGAGLNAERIRAKALERGLIEPEAELTEEQLFDLIMQPGFSTKQKTSDLSGRGVGMDVVRKNVEELNGTVAMSSRAGEGTRATITLPLTLAILDGLSVRVGPDRFVLPLVSIIESLRPKPEHIRRPAGEREIVLVRGETLPLVRLHELFEIEDAVTDPSAALVVIVEHEGRLLALLVDELLGHLQVVIKSLEANFRRVEGALGATILGDGRAALILDISGLAVLADEWMVTAEPPAAQVEEPVEEPVNS